MRLNGREKQLIQLLREGPATGRQLADALGVSRRTVLRDILRLNALLESCNAGQIESGLNYSLRIDSVRALDALVQNTYDEVTEVLLALVTLPSVTVGELSDLTSLPAGTVRKSIDAINMRYRDILHITSQAGRGLNMVFYKLGPVDLLAALCAQNKAIKSEVEMLANAGLTALGSLIPEVEEYRTKLEPWLTATQVNIQVNASIATACFVQKTAASTNSYRDAVRAFIAEKLQTHAWLVLKRYELMGLAADMLNQHGVQGMSANLPNLIFAHIARAALFPTIMDDEFRSQIEELRIAHPFEFDFARIYCSRVELMHPGLLLEPELCALYVIGTAARSDTTPTSILLLSARKSLESVNRALLEQAMNDATIVLADDASSAIKKYQTQSFDLLIRDEACCGSEIDELPWDLVTRGILRDKDLALLQRSVLYTSYKKSLATMLPQEQYVALPADCLTYEEVLSKGLDVFIQRGRMNKEEAAATLARELQGERLAFNGVAVPHCVTNVPSNNFRLFAICPTTTVHTQDEDINLILVVFASKHQDDKNTIFSYVYSMLSTQTLSAPNISYLQLMNLLGLEK
ncbi:MAG: HTH domain-containing protein [Atopobium sp.]|uniref:HTH domain-containing protein n=1 Tax=Atopobium sp. TaxID=1872650 RepID=UPI002A748684|nr:HTH domain-containing protein [Atopobium sp.]MDY2788762.1 HTH domain-containing protein [Atopobium sp.]